MSFDSDIADIRFGCGLSPVIAAPTGIDDMIERLHATDSMARAFPIEHFDVFRYRMMDAQRLRKRQRAARGTQDENRFRKEVKLIKKSARQAMIKWTGQTVQRWTHTETGFRERLVSFWADHFTATGKAGVIKRATSPYVEDAIRPRITGRFADLLIDCVTHPVMQEYLDQHRSIGPNSRKAQRTSGRFGLNENLAREVLELHTLGVDGPYKQQDVQQLAELFSGLTFTPQEGRKYRKDFAEPGPETVLGTRYSFAESLTPIRAVLEDLSSHPATARHIAQKLAVHFVSDNPEPGLVDHMAARYLETDGQLADVYLAMLEHPAAWEVTCENAKPPFDFVASSCRALAISPNRFDEATEKQLRFGLIHPMAQMGQSWQRPTGPDGWPEEDSFWITAQGLAARLHWAMTIPKHLVETFPDPRSFVDLALGRYVSPAVRFAASAAETKSDAIGLVLSSPAFQKR